ncbi:hypothetical protein dsmv_2967, partial [Desulfococcus multivorans DSM 2059]
ELGGRRVNLKRITMPLLNIYGKFDHLVPPEACERLTRAVGSEDTEDLCLNTGHIGIYVSARYQAEFAPKIAAWLKAREDGGKKAVESISATPHRVSRRKKSSPEEKTPFAAASKASPRHPSQKRA